MEVGQYEYGCKRDAQSEKRPPEYAFPGIKAIRFGEIQKKIDSNPDKKINIVPHPLFLFPAYQPGIYIFLFLRFHSAKPPKQS